MKKNLPYKSLFGIKTIKYRIVRDRYLGYEAQKWRIYFPFYIEMHFPGYISNTFDSIDDAIRFIEIDYNSKKIILTS